LQALGIADYDWHCDEWCLAVGLRLKNYEGHVACHSFIASVAS